MRDSAILRTFKGTQDFLDLSLFNFLLAKTKEYLQCYNFTQIKTPIFEPAELFKRSSGLKTGIVTQEMYTVNTGSDKETIKNTGNYCAYLQL